MDASKNQVDVIETVEEQPDLKGRDKAAELLNSAGREVIVSTEDNKRLLRKIDLAILPILLTVYALQSLDKTSLSYASVFDLIDATHLDSKSNQYAWLGSIVYVAQLVWQPLIALALVRLPVGRFCGIMVFCWAATLCGMAAAKDFGGLLAARFLLGSFEASVAPTFIAIVQLWYRRSEQTLRNAAWYSMLGVVNILGSLLTFGLGHIQSSVLHSYQIIFLFCGLLTLVFSIVVLLFLPDSPMTARFLNHEEKLMAIERLRMNQQGISSKVWKWNHLTECLLDIKTWIWFSMLTAISIVSGGITTFGPLIVKSFGFSSFQTILFNMPFGAVQLIATLLSAYISTRYKIKSAVIAFLCIPAIIGTSILLGMDRSPSNRGVLLFAYYILSVYPAITPMIYSWSGQNTAGDTKKKSLTAIIFIGASVGNIIGPLLYTTAEAPYYTRGLKSNLALLIIVFALSGFGALYISILNKKHETDRERLGKSAKVVDLSMADSKELVANGDALNARGEQNLGARAFDDITDLQNEDFVYVY